MALIVETLLNAARVLDAVDSDLRRALSTVVFCSLEIVPSALEHIEAMTQHWLRVNADEPLAMESADETEPDREEATFLTKVGARHKSADRCARPQSCVFVLKNYRTMLWWRPR